MKLHTLTPAKGSTKSTKRIGRGQGSGRGGTSTRGHKGAQSRSGYSKKFGFEGGQMPLQRRIPKYGFNPRNKTHYVAINLDNLQSSLDDSNISEFTFERIQELGWASASEIVKVLGRGEIKGAVTVHVHAISESAKKAIEDKGGKVELI